MFGPIGMPELILIFLVALLVFGPKKLPELGRSLGKGIAEFKRASDDLKRTIEDEIEQGKHQASAVQDEVASARRQANELRNTVASTVGSAPAAPATPAEAVNAAPEAPAPVVVVRKVGAPGQPELAEELTNSFCRTDPDIAAHFALMKAFGTPTVFDATHSVQLPGAGGAALGLGGVLERPARGGGAGQPGLRQPGRGRGPAAR